MLTAVVWGVSTPRPFASTLAALVPAAVDGALREVVVAGLPNDPDCRSIADHAGCRVAATDGVPAEASARLRGSWILLLRSGDRLPEDWLDGVDRHLARSDRPARLTVQRHDWPRWRRLVGWRAFACLVPRDELGRNEAATWTALASAPRGPVLRTGRPRRD